MPTWIEQDCPCQQFRAVYGDHAAWFTHWAHDCSAVAPWIVAWAQRRLPHVVVDPGTAPVRASTLLPPEEAL